MSPRLDLGPKPLLGYVASTIERAAERRGNAAALCALESDAQARAYAISGELVVLNKGGDLHDPLFPLSTARGFGDARELVFLGLAGAAPQFALAVEPDSIEALKSSADFVISDLRSIAVRGLISAEHLPPLAEGKALLNWHSRH